MARIARAAGPTRDSRSSDRASVPDTTAAAPGERRPASKASPMMRTWSSFIIKTPPRVDFAPRSSSRPRKTAASVRWSRPRVGCGRARTARGRDRAPSARAPLGSARDVLRPARRGSGWLTPRRRRRRARRSAPRARQEPTDEPHRRTLGGRIAALALDDARRAPPRPRPPRRALPPRGVRPLRGRQVAASRWSLARFLREWKSRATGLTACWPRSSEIPTTPPWATPEPRAREHLRAPVVDADRLRGRKRAATRVDPTSDPPPPRERASASDPPRPPPRPTARSYPAARPLLSPRAPSRSSSAFRPRRRLPPRLLRPPRRRPPRAAAPRQPGAARARAAGGA